MATHPTSRLGLAAVAVLVLAVAVWTARCPAGEREKAVAQDAAAEFLAVEAAALKLNWVTHYAWTDKCQFQYGASTLVDVMMPEMRVVAASGLPEEWTRTHGEEILGEVDEARALALAERFIARRLELPEGHSLKLSDHHVHSDSKKSYDFLWHPYAQGVRLRGGVSISVSRSRGRVVHFGFGIAPLTVSLEPTVTREQAIRAAEGGLEVVGLADREERRLAECSLYVDYFPLDAEPHQQVQRLCWAVDFEYPVWEEETEQTETEEAREVLRRDPPSSVFYVDARNGELLDRWINPYLYVPRE
jgi:hypothetical protein